MTRKEEFSWNYDNKTMNVIVIDEEEFQDAFPLLFKATKLSPSAHSIQFCKAIHYSGILAGTFVIPKKEHPISHKDIFAFCIEGNTLYFVDYDHNVEPLLKDMEDNYEVTLTTPVMFLLDFMSYLVYEDVYFLEKYITKLQQIEMDMYDGKNNGVEQMIMQTRRDMNVLSSYYLQLSDLGETIESLLIEHQAEEGQALVNLYLSRVNQLYSMVQTVKNYTDQIWNLRQTQLQDKQNKISTVLTVITVIFLPLTLITGWFGMNFVHMPFIRSSNGYYSTVVLCVIIVICEIWYCRKHGLFK